MTVTIIKGDCRDVLRTMESESVHCVVTSPPYWGLRDYGVGGQLGMERTLGEHVETMADVFREVRRVLRGDGTLWLNYGDSYATSVNGRSAADTKAAGNDDRTFRDKPFSTIGPIYDPTPSGAGGSYEDERPGWAADRGRIRAGGMLKPKDLCGIPWRVAFALQADGWYLRQDIIWSKPNPMPESVRDRCTKAHEYIFLLSKSERYYYDQGAIKQQAAPASFARLGQDIENQNGSNRVPGKTNGPMKAVYGGKNKHDGYGTRIHSGNEDAGNYLEAGVNRRSVWEVPTHPFSDAHFATFPPALIEPCIKAGTSSGGCCSQCGGPWKRTIQRVLSSGGQTSNRQWSEEYREGFSQSCACRVAGDAGRDDITHPPPVPCTVLDPFGGAGTTGLVADRLGRNSILIELNPEYAAMAERRIKNDAGMFACVAAE
jgi:DNA modification methylase